MDIRVGTDIKINFDLSKINILNVDSLKRIRCFFLRNDYCECECKPVPPFSNPTQYTIHDCGIPVYNVHALKHGCDPHHCDPHDRGFCVLDGWYAKDAYSTSVFELVEGENPRISVRFPGKVLKIGNYRVVLEVVNREDVGDFKKNHQYRFDFGYPFNLTDKAAAHEGDMVIDMFTAEQDFIYATKNELYELDSRLSARIAAVENQIKDLQEYSTEREYNLYEENENITVDYFNSESANPNILFIYLTLNNPSLLSIYVDESLTERVHIGIQNNLSLAQSDIYISGSINAPRKWTHLYGQTAKNTYCYYFPAGWYKITIDSPYASVTKLRIKSVTEYDQNAANDVATDVMLLERRVDETDRKLLKIDELRENLDVTDDALSTLSGEVDEMSERIVDTVATTTDDGLMSAEDKKKFDELSEIQLVDISDYLHENSYLPLGNVLYTYYGNAVLPRTFNAKLPGDDDSTIYIAIEEKVSLPEDNIYNYLIFRQDGLFLGNYDQDEAPIGCKEVFGRATATWANDGLMSTADKQKLDNISESGYTVPEGGIPKTDLSIDIQNSLNKANSALQEHQDLSLYAKKSEIPTVNLSPYALKTDIPAVPSKTSDLINDAGFITEHLDLSGYVLESELKTVNNLSIVGSGNINIQAGVTSVNGQTGPVTLNIPTVPTNVSEFINDANYATESWVEDKGYLTSHLSLDGYVTEDDLNDYVKTEDLSNIFKQWFGTLSEYDEIVVKDPNTIYNIYEDKYEDYDLA